METDGYDIIGDVHGCADELELLLHAMGYEERDGCFRHKRRQAVFVGDLIDRGPRQIDTYRIARTMVEAGAALIVAANHEFNAIAWGTPASERPTGWLRDHDTKRSQHQEFLAQVGEGSTLHHEMLDWFRTLPLWLELDGFRVVHACWDAERIAWLDREWGRTPLGDERFMRAATDKWGKPPEWIAAEHLLKGPEVAIDPPYVDKDGSRREEARMNWWRVKTGADHRARIGDVAYAPPDVSTPSGEPWRIADPDALVPIPVAPYDQAKPVFFGHYWFSGEPRIEGPKVACTDWSAVKGGCLAAYRWSGEAHLTDENWVSVVATGCNTR